MKTPTRKMKETTWHPYPEEKPTKKGTYLVTLQNKYDPKVYSDYVTEWDYDEDGFLEFRTENIIAWMEMPKPYKKEE